MTNLAAELHYLTAGFVFFGKTLIFVLTITPRIDEKSSDFYPFSRLCFSV